MCVCMSVSVCVCEYCEEKKSSMLDEHFPLRRRRLCSANRLHVQMQGQQRQQQIDCTFKCRDSNDNSRTSHWRSIRGKHWACYTTACVPTAATRPLKLFSPSIISIKWLLLVLHKYQHEATGSIQYLYVR